MLTDGNRVVLVDSGIGLHDVADPIARVGEEPIKVAGFKFIESVTAARQLEAMSVYREAVTDIILTHCDADHVGGLADFPHATVHLSTEELANVESGNPRFSSLQFSHGPKWQAYATNDSMFFDLTARTVKTSLDIDIQLVPLFGHTLGHCGVALVNDDSMTFHIGDAYYLRAELDDPEHLMDEISALAAEDDSQRRQSLEKLRHLHKGAHPDLQMFGYHDLTELPEGIPQYEEVI